MVFFLVLPKYEITVKASSVLAIDATKFDGEICAMYTYGEPVRGDVSAKFCIKSRGYRWYGGRDKRPCVDIVATEVVGCHPFSIDVDQLSVRDRKFGSIYNSFLQFDAKITELATGSTLHFLPPNPVQY